MKASELRIGNWYHEFGIPKKATAEFILRLDNIQISRIAIDVSPIPLTEEWILKFGVKALRKGLFDFVKVEDSIGFHVYFIGRHLKETQYVHELQNLYFSITGEELILSE